jgi:hypothetical protein
VTVDRPFDDVWAEIQAKCDEIRARKDSIPNLGDMPPMYIQDVADAWIECRSDRLRGNTRVYKSEVKRIWQRLVENGKARRTQRSNLHAPLFAWTLIGRLIDGVNFLPKSFSLVIKDRERAMTRFIQSAESKDLLKSVVSRQERKELGFRFDPDDLNRSWFIRHSSAAVNVDNSAQSNGQLEGSELLLPSVVEREPVDTRSDETIMSWNLILAPRARESSAIRLTKSVAETMAQVGEMAPFQVRFYHPDIEPALSQQPVRLEGSNLVGVRWPPQFFIGMLLYASWSRDGYFVTVEGQQLAQLAILDGIPLDYAFDEETVLRSWGTPTDLASPDEMLGPAVVLQILRLAGLRVEGITPTTLFLPWDTLIAQIGRDPRFVGLDSVELARQAEGVVEMLSRRSPPEGSVIVEWAIGIPTNDPGAEHGWYFRPLPGGNRTGWALPDLAVTLRLGARTVQRSNTGSESLVTSSHRRGHPRVLTRGTPSAAKRAQLLEWARAHGIDPSWLNPRTTFVEEADVRSHRRRSE